jgi:N-acyl-phosphatidylethanolamine-hydrolysing phospholipase D
VARYATSRDTPTYGNPPGSPVRGGGVPSRGIVRMVTGAIEGVAPPRRDRHVLTRAEAIDPLRSTEDRVTWLGHAGFAIRLAGIDVLVDPFLDDFASPVWGIGPRRLDPSPFRASDMLHPHVVLLSHNHYDHLDRRTLFALPGRTAAWAVVPEGLGPYVRQIGFAHVTELPWGASVDVGPVTVTSIPAVHFSGRGLFDRNRTHWNGYLIASKRRRVYFAGDTAYSPTLGAAASIGGACDIALVPIGAYMPKEIMSAVHSTPEEAVQIGRDARASRVLGMHWGTIPLSTEPTFEPPLRFTAEALRSGYRGDEVLTPAIGSTTFLEG